MRGRIPKYRKHSSNRGFAEWLGRRHYLPGDYGRAESLAAYRAFLRSHALSDPPSPAPVGGACVADLASAFLGDAAGRYGTADASSPYHHFRRALVDLVELAGELPVVEFGPLRLAELRRGWVARGLARKHINLQVQRVRQVFRWGISRELVPASVLEGLRSLPGLRASEGGRETTARGVVAWEVVEATLSHLSPVVAAMVTLQWHTGARSGNVCRLTPGELDTSGEVWGWRPAQHKTASRGHSLVVWIGPAGQCAVRPYLLRAADSFCFSPRVASASGRARDRYDSRSYRQAVGYGIAAARRAGAEVPDWSPHQLRHSRATLIRERFGLEAAQASLGHASIGATQIYARRLEGLAVQVARETG